MRALNTKTDFSSKIVLCFQVQHWECLQTTEFPTKLGNQKFIIMLSRKYQKKLTIQVFTEELKAQ